MVLYNSDMEKLNWILHTSFYTDVQSVIDIYSWFNLSLVEKGYHPDHAPSVDTRLYEKCSTHTKKTKEESKGRIMHRTTGAPNDGEKYLSSDLYNRSLRVIATTVAFSLGVTITDIDEVIHWGTPHDVLTYWQVVGRCGRDGRQGRAIMYR